MTRYIIHPYLISSILIALTLLVNTGLRAQTTENKLSIGIHVNQSGYEGFMIQPTVGYQMNNFLTAQAGFGIQPVNSLFDKYNVRLGLMAKAFEVKRLSIHLGMNYVFTRADLSDLSPGDNVIERLNRFELSGNLLYRISSELSFQLGLNNSILSWFEDDPEIEYFQYYVVNVGVNYHF